MKNKIIILVLVLFVFAAASTFAIGVGGAFSFSPFGDSVYYGGALTFKIDDWPLIGVAASGDSGNFNLGATADWWYYNDNLTGPLNLYAGVGGYGMLSMGNNTNIDLGLRIPFGLNIFVIDPLEIFLELAPAAGIRVGDNFRFPVWNLQSAVGFRFWF